MTRKELSDLIVNQLSVHVFAAKDSFIDALWPVLAQVWEEGYGDAYDDAHDSSRLHPTINPYGEVSA